MQVSTRFKVEYDIVMCFLCMENAVLDLNGFTSGIAKIFSLIKEGGHLLFMSDYR